MLVPRREEVPGRGGRFLTSGAECAAKAGGVGGVDVVAGVDVAVVLGRVGIREPQTAPRPCSSPKAAYFSNPFSRPKILPSIRPARAPSVTPWECAVVYRVSSRVRRSSKGSGFVGAIVTILAAVDGDLVLVLFDMKLRLSFQCE